MSPSTAPAGLDERNHTAMERLIRVLRLHHRVVDRRMEALSIHHSQHRMLMRLARMGRTASQKDIAAALEVSPACVARTLKALSASGLIDKCEGEDSRRNEISILPRGQQLIEDSIAIMHQIDRETFEGLCDDEVLMLSNILERIHDNLCRMEAADTPGKGGNQA